MKFNSYKPTPGAVSLSWDTPESHSRYYGFNVTENKAILTDSLDKFDTMMTSASMVFFELDQNNEMQSMILARKAMGSRMVSRYVFYPDRKAGVVIADTLNSMYADTTLRDLQGALTRSMNVLASPEVDMLDARNVLYFKMLHKVGEITSDLDFRPVVGKVEQNVMQQFLNMDDDQRAAWDKSRTAGGLNRFQLIEQSAEGDYVLPSPNVPGLRYVLQEGDWYQERMHPCVHQWQKTGYMGLGEESCLEPHVEKVAPAPTWLKTQPQVPAPGDAKAPSPQANR